MTDSVRLRRSAVAALVMGLTFTGVPAATAAPVDSVSAHCAAEWRKATAVRVVKGLFEAGDTGIVDRFVRADYIQHNPFAQSGAKAVKDFAVSTHQRFPQLKYDVKRVIAEGDLVLLHSNVVFTPGTAGMAVTDIFRFQDGLIAEHWDVGETVTATGHDPFATLSTPRRSQPGPGWLTPGSKLLVTAFFDRLMVHHDLSAVDVFAAPGLVQHGAGVVDGAAGLKTALRASFARYPGFSVEPKRVVAEGDLVAVHSHYRTSADDRGRAVLDLYRVRYGKVVEQWTLSQDVPAASANDNTMF